MSGEQSSDKQTLGDKAAIDLSPDLGLEAQGNRGNDRSITLTPQSTDFIERLQNTQFVEVYVMTSKIFRQKFMGLIAQEYRDHIPFEDGTSVDKLGRNYPGIKITIEVSPHIIYTEAAYPCSIIIVWDEKGNAAIAHMTQYQVLDESPEKQQKQKAKGNQTFDKMTQFANQNLTDNRALIITATNLDDKMRSSIVDSITTGIRGLELSDIGYVFTDGGNLIDSRKDVPKGKLRTTANSIDGTYFIPRQLTNNGNNIVILVGDDKQSKETSLNDWEWRQSLPRSSM